MQARYVNLKPPQDSFDLFCLLQGWRGTGYHPTYHSILQSCDSEEKLTPEEQRKFDEIRCRGVMAE